MTSPADTVVILSRLQFAITTLFHILWPVLTIGLSLFLLVTELLWLRTGDIDWYHHSRFWGRLFLLNFGVGVVTGCRSNLNSAPTGRLSPTSPAVSSATFSASKARWPSCSRPGFLGIMLFGWNRVPRAMHLIATSMVAFGASISAFWILVANSWMQTPAGGHMENGRFVVDSYLEAIFNPDMPWGVSHMWVACLETSMFVIGGISAWHFCAAAISRSFANPFCSRPALAVIVTPMQIWLGDGSGKTVSRTSRPKARRSREIGTPTRPASRRAWALLAWPDKSAAAQRLAGRSTRRAVLSRDRIRSTAR